MTLAMPSNWKNMARDLQKMFRTGLRIDEPMSKHTTIGVGGRARILATPTSMDDVARLIRYAGAKKVDYVVIGKGSNLIVRDGGYDGIVIKMSSRLGRVTVNQRTVRAEGGASFAALARRMTKMGRTGLEFGVGIPGTVGGAVRMNAGAFGGEVKDVLRRVKIVEANGRLRTVPASDIEFGYRRTSLSAGCVVLSATFACVSGTVKREVVDRAIGRKETQPIDARSFGSTFVNPPEGFAAQMIEGCGLKGARRGGAMISGKHANFIVNEAGTATASDVEGLIKLMRNEVEKKYGVTLKTEVIVIGNR